MTGEHLSHDVQELLRLFHEHDAPSVSDAAELAEADVVLQFGLPPNRVDLLSNLVGVGFAAAWRRRVTETLVPEEGDPFPVYFIGLSDLLKNKRAVGRHKDLDDVEHLAPVLRRRSRRAR